MALKNAAVLILYNEKKEVLLQNRSKNAPRLPDYWAFFGGGIESGEAPRDAMRREILEELEYRVSDPVLFLEQAVMREDGQVIKHVFIEKYDTAQPPILHEGQAMRWCAFGDLDKLLIVGHDREVLARIQEYLKSISD